MKLLRICGSLLVLLVAAGPIFAQAQHRYLYVATPGIRDCLGYGGHGLLVFDIDKDHSFVKRIPLRGFHPNGKPANVKGIAVSIPLNSIDGKYVYLSSGEVIDVRMRKILCTMKDEFNNSVASGKMVEVDFDGEKPVRAGDQFGIGHVTF
ncbi:MAG TPA: hypothetical protein VHE34_01495 [Puia sp.]|uniref:hypothetical protein n=1 Tax=Puia sp. TaxID=2045100 RepID=UPI002CCE3CD3|nr:hypothetical protein [Puia sp.]HVU93859.1 hypothetical protein [Puia sp.]